MPEGDTIHKIAEAIRPRLEGQRIVRARIGHRPRHRAVADLNGRSVESVYASGKHLLFVLSGGLVLRTHLGMYGSWHRYRVDESWRKPESQLSLALWTEREVYVCFNGRELTCLPTASISQNVFQLRLGPDLLHEPIAPAALVGRVRDFLEPQTPLVDVLLDQRAASGIGNVYKSEVLFIERTHPLTTLVECSDEELVRLYATAAQLLRRNLGGGRRRTRFPDDGAGRLWVYGRRNKPCHRCGTAVRYQRLGRDLRGTYWCPSCQLPGSSNKRTVPRVSGAQDDSERQI